MIHIAPIRNIDRVASEWEMGGKFQRILKKVVHECLLPAYVDTLSGVIG